jgi:hypothetical protein
LTCTWNSGRRVPAAPAASAASTSRMRFTDCGADRFDGTGRDDRGDAVAPGDSIAALPHTQTVNDSPLSHHGLPIQCFAAVACMDSVPERCGTPLHLCCLPCLCSVGACDCACASVCLRRCLSVRAITGASVCSVSVRSFVCAGVVCLVLFHQCECVCTCVLVGVSRERERRCMRASVRGCRNLASRSLLFTLPPTKHTDSLTHSLTHSPIPVGVCGA